MGCASARERRARAPSRAPDEPGAGGEAGSRPTWPVLVVVAALVVAGLIWAVTSLGGRYGTTHTISDRHTPITGSAATCLAEMRQSGGVIPRAQKRHGVRVRAPDQVALVAQRRAWDSNPR